METLLLVFLGLIAFVALIYVCFYISVNLFDLFEDDETIEEYSNGFEEYHDCFEEYCKKHN